jgi:dolichyl-phosphate-mannose-protein mannosyltransferase
VAYVAVARPYIVDGDNAEFATLGATGGVAHPSGYPLYLLVLRAVPGSAYAAAVATAVIAALSVFVLHAACRAWGARPLAASVAAGIFAGAPVVMRMSSQAEVFALDNLVVATVLWLSARGAPLRGIARAGVLGLVAGLGISDHLTCALVAPVGILGVVRGAREAPAIRAAGAAFAGLVVGLLPYLYLTATVDTAISWGPVDDLADIIAMIARRDYGGPGSFAASGDSSVGANLGALFASLARAWLWLPAALGLGALAYRIARPGDDSGETRAAWLALAASWLVAGPILAATFNVPPEKLGLYIVQRFHILPTLLLVIPVAVGLDLVARRIARDIQPRRAFHALAICAFVFAGARSLPYLQRVRTHALELGVVNMLRSLPPGAVAMVSSDDLFYGAGYVQDVLGERQDVVVMSRPLLGFAWYRARLARRGVPVVLAGPTPIRHVAEQVLALGRPLFAEVLETEVLRTLPSSPHGTLFRVVPAGAHTPSLDQVIADNHTVFAAFDLSDPQPGPDDEYPTAVHSRYAYTWGILAKALAAAKRTDEARAAMDLARELGPSRD